MPITLLWLRCNRVFKIVNTPPIAAVQEPWIAVIVFITLASYIPLTIYLTEWRGQFRR